MKDAEEPDKNAHDLRPIELYYDDDQELISSLVILTHQEQPKNLVLINIQN